MPPAPIEVLLARRPKAGTSAFGHVDISQDGREKLDALVSNIVEDLQGSNEIPFDADDDPDTGEVLTADLSGFDAHFQPDAQWSLERVVAEIRAPSPPDPLTASEIRNGGWSFYAIRAPAGSGDVIIVRGRSPTWGFSERLITRLVGTELRPLSQPLIAFDRNADLVIIADKVFVLNPSRAESLFVDADAVKARAADTVAALTRQLPAGLSDATADALVRLCSKNANVARRVERLLRAGTLSRVNAPGVRAALPDAGLDASAFGDRGDLRAESEAAAQILVDVIADLYYQPRFDAPSRRVAAFRRVRSSLTAQRRN